jgi:hypothetical protein
LTEAFAFLFHALVLHEIGVDAEVLNRAMTYGGLAEVKIIPALNRVGIHLGAISG